MKKERRALVVMGCWQLVKNCLIQTEQEKPKSSSLVIRISGISEH